MTKATSEPLGTPVTLMPRVECLSGVRSVQLWQFPGRCSLVSFANQCMQPCRPPSEVSQGDYQYRNALYLVLVTQNLVTQ